MNQTVETWIEPGRQWWLQRTTQERTLIALMASLLSAYLVYLFMYSPLNQAVDIQREALKTGHMTLRWIEDMSSQLKRLRLATGVSPDLLSNIHDSLETDPILKGYPYQLEQPASGSVELTFEQVPFTPFVQWAYRLERSSRFQITQLQVEKGKAPGLVKLLFVLHAA